MKASKESLTLTGALAAAVTASACCIGPLVFAALGLGGAAFAVALEPYRLYFIGLTLALLGVAFYLVYRTPRAETCEPGGICETRSGGSGLKVLLWIVTLLVLGALTFPYYASYLF